MLNVLIAMMDFKLYMFEFLLALLAGIVTIGGPCILPLLPIVLGTSTTGRHPLRPVAIVFGFTLAFTVFALIFSFVGSFLGLNPATWRIVASILIGFFGIFMLFPALQARAFAKLEPIMQKMSPKGALQKNDLWSGFLLGLSLGAIWTPCAGPVLGSILTLIAAKQNLIQASGLLFAFSVGAGLPMLLIAYGGQLAVQKVSAISKYTGLIQRLFGIIVILTAIAIAIQFDITIQNYLIEKYPWLFIALEFEI